MKTYRRLRKYGLYKMVRDKRYVTLYYDSVWKKDEKVKIAMNNNIRNHFRKQDWAFFEKLGEQKMKEDNYEPSFLETLSIFNKYGG